MKGIFATLIVSVLAVALPCYGTVFWENQADDGSRSTQNKGSISHSSISYGNSDGSVVATCVYQGMNGTRYHSEWGPTGNWNHDDRYFGYAFYLPDDWSFSGPERHVIIQHGTRLPSGKTINPDWYQQWIRGHTLFMGPVDGITKAIGTVTTGTWHRVITHMKFGSDGVIEVWFDGERKFSCTNLDVKGDTDDGLWALGLYEADWLNGKVGSQKTRSVYQAKCRIADSYEEADPDSW